MKLLSVNVSLPLDIDIGVRSVSTGMFKRQVDAQLQLPNLIWTVIDKPT